MKALIPKERMKNRFSFYGALEILEKKNRSRNQKKLDY